jgi:YggT family protein
MADSILFLLIQVLQILGLALFVRAILSWFDPGMQWGITRILADVTEPVLAPIRRVVPPIGMIDISFIVAIVLIMILQRLLAQVAY